MAVWNVFRFLGDISHTVSKCILIWAIHSNTSAEGVSLITQFLYVLVFLTRYLDLFWTDPRVSLWNFTLKNFYIWSSIYVIVLMTRVFPRSREREKAYKLGASCLGASAMFAPFVAWIFTLSQWSVSKTLWTFSEILESVCVLPQLLLLRQTSVPTVIDSFYLLTLGSYRGFYILNWIVRAADPDDHPGRAHPISIIFGCIQTAFFVDFAWVYWTRQRVKLRGGGVVDSDDLSKGWLINRVLRGRTTDTDEESYAAPRADDDEHYDEAHRPKLPRKTGVWGPRGISVSADEDIEDSPSRTRTIDRTLRGEALGSSSEALDGILEDEDEDEADGTLPAHVDASEVVDGIGDGREWTDSGK